MAKKKDLSNARSATLQVRSGQMRSEFDETSEALYLTSGFVYESCEEADLAFSGEKERYLYGRYANPTNTMFEQRLAAIEGADFCVGVSSGMAAVSSTLQSSLSPGDRLVASKALFGNCFWIVNTLLPRLGVEVVLVNGMDNDAWAEALSVPTDIVFFETPSNPTMQLIDMEFVCSASKRVGAMVIVDNVFATPIGQKPFEFGADIVVYSTTKHIDGQGRCLAGAVLSNNKTWIEDILFPYIRNTGPSLSPFNAWTMLKGMETLSLRLDKQSQNAMQLAQYLESLDGVEAVMYPGLESHPQHDLAKKQMKNFGTLLGIYFKGDKTHTYNILNNLNIIDISNNLGDVKSLITFPGSTTHSKLSEEERLEVGITENFVRLSVGLEDIEDLKEDLLQAMSK